MTSKEQAITLLKQAYDKLAQAGIKEEFAHLSILVSQQTRGTFFGSFGSESGCFIEFESQHNALTPVRLSFGMRRVKQSYWKRIQEMLRVAWGVLRAHDSEYEIYLCPEDITKMKDLLQAL